MSKAKYVDMEIVLAHLGKSSLQTLKEVAVKMGLDIRQNKAEIMEDISVALREYDSYRKEKVTKYQREHQIGEQGKEGTTFLVKDVDGRTYAMKTFRRAKSSKTLTKEYMFLKKAGKSGISPLVHDHDTVSKYIVMEKMDRHLFDEETKKSGELSKEHQKRIIEIFGILDDIGIFHNDANTLNYMLKDGEIYLIDFGMAKEITPKVIRDMGTTRPNSRLMLISLILSMRQLKFHRKSYKYLLKYVSDGDKERFKLK